MRAVSTACYSMFHSLIADGVGYCGDKQLASALARIFEHGAMKSESDTKVSEINGLFDPQPPDEPLPTVAYHLHNVAGIQPWRSWLANVT